MASTAEAVIKCKGKDYPELSIDQSRLFTPETRCTLLGKAYDSKLHKANRTQVSTHYTLDPYSVGEVRAETERHKHIAQLSIVEAETDKIRVHSEDYFPVSTSS